MSLGLIWAQSASGVIGRDGQLPWHLPEDLAHFKATTMGHPVMMGRRTWDSLPRRFRPLPGRRNIVLTRQRGWTATGADVRYSMDEALTQVDGQAAWVIGGAEVYRAALPHAEVAEVTEIDVDVAGDTYAPDLKGWTQVHAREWQVSTTGLHYRFIRYQPRSLAEEKE
jgi:dihydrofolate reductase